jgi:hypothetical protein
MRCDKTPVPRPQTPKEWAKTRKHGHRTTLATTWSNATATPPFVEPSHLCPFPSRLGSMSGSSERYLPYIAVSVIGTALIYAARLVSAGDTEDDSHLRWRCPLGTVSAILFGVGQLCGVMSIASKKSLSFSLRRHDEPPARGLLRFYTGVSAVSAATLMFVLLWISGLFPQPRCLSGSQACLRLQKNLQQKGWITLALIGLAGFQLMGTAAAARSLSLCCCAGVDDSGPAAAAACEAIDTLPPVAVIAVACQPAAGTKQTPRRQIIPTLTC